MTDKDFVDFDYGDCANCQYRADYSVPVDGEVVETYSECSLLCRGLWICNCILKERRQA